jgi:cytochrome c-type protein NapC
LLPTFVIIALGIGVAIAVMLFLGAGTMAAHTWGRIALLVGVVALPLLISAGNLTSGFEESSRTRFCLSCHEMQRHGMSLFADNHFALAAAHYQSRLVDRDHACYSCHADYAMFGDAKAKINGLRHVWVHYFRPIPSKISLYQPYSIGNCRHCHDDSRRFVEAPAHQPVLKDIYAGKVSCLGCHTVAHDMTAVDEHRFWNAE